MSFAEKMESRHKDSQEQGFHEFGLLYARILKNRKDLALAERIATEYADKMNLPVFVFGMTETGRCVSGFPPSGGKSAIAAGSGAPPSSPVNSEKMGEVMTLIEELEQEERELQGALELGEELILDAYEKRLGVVPERTATVPPAMSTVM